VQNYDFLFYHTTINAIFFVMFRGNDKKQTMPILVFGKKREFEKKGKSKRE